MIAEAPAASTTEHPPMHLLAKLRAMTPRGERAAQRVII
jgi:hypothetical protein